MNHEVIHGVVVRPGDTLILGFDGKLTVAQADEIKQRIASRLPDLDAVIVSGATSIAVYRPGEEVEHAAS